MTRTIYKIIFLAKKKNLFSSGFEPETFRVLGGCDNQLHHENTLKHLLFLDYLLTSLNNQFYQKFKTFVMP